LVRGCRAFLPLKSHTALLRSFAWSHGMTIVT
jgi:hypothetical protein